MGYESRVFIMLSEKRDIAGESMASRTSISVLPGWTQLSRARLGDDGEPFRRLGLPLRRS